MALIVVALFTATFRPAPAGLQVLAHLGLEDHPELLPLAERTERRARRIRRVGAIAGLLAGAWIGSGHHDSLGNSLAAPWVGYVAGLLVAELSCGCPKHHDPQRHADPHRMGPLSQPWWRVASTRCSCSPPPSRRWSGLGAIPPATIPTPDPR